MSGRLILIGGGARSGKSAFALTLARKLGGSRAFVATAQGLDEEMQDRIRRHRDDRGLDFETIEEPLDLAGALKRVRTEVVVVDCLTLWLSNLLCRGDPDDAILERVGEVVGCGARRDRIVVVVTNEVGLGLVPDTPLGRRFRDLTGTANQRFAAEADDVYFGVMGLIARVKPGPFIEASR